MKRLAAAALVLALCSASAQDADGSAAGAPTLSPSEIAALCRMARRGDAPSQYELAWLFAHGRGELRRDEWAHYLFFAAASNS